jgi:hypothetical protein
MESSERSPEDVTGEHQEQESQPEPSADPASPAEEPVQADPDPGDPAPEGAIPEGESFDPTHSAPATVPDEEGVPRQHGDVNPGLGQSPSAFPGDTPAEEPADEEPSDEE